ncbi:hypothetical protein [Paenibacillus sp. Soil750]|uniref:hypothetical protein n=1 Tax=Paenibacillus sp. Soil750 TaxID=1736398 RepID=UPI0006F885BC|nr:hypothetical protein [Paenibacillus sp. Soil750]KRE71982.1 hypothetical protein ASL11_09400 [Paenibacillus sp. Soil750]
MIQLETYSDTFKNEYWKAVGDRIDTSVRRKIVDSCKKYMPSDFFTGSQDEFQSLILAPLENLIAAQAYIASKTINIMNQECFRNSNGNKPPMRAMYKTIHDSYTSLADSVVGGTSLRVRIVRKAGLTVCPYCNRDYINCRAEKVSGAQLDHFFNRSTFPLFSICLYNLIPVCGNCNRVKSSKALTFASPYDSSINWAEDLTFSYHRSALNEMEIIIEAKGNLENNMQGMRIREAYQIHGDEVLELIEKQQMYNRTQKDELQAMLGRVGLTDLEIKKMVFGPKITKETMRTKPLGKMMHDLHKELKIYN